MLGRASAVWLYVLLAVIGVASVPLVMTRARAAAPRLA
jgi:hypothetical protein